MLSLLHTEISQTLIMKEDRPKHPAVHPAVSIISEVSALNQVRRKREQGLYTPLSVLVKIARLRETSEPVDKPSDSWASRTQNSRADQA